MLIDVCQEWTLKEVQCYTKDEGRPLKTGLQKQVLNHHMLLGLKVLVVSDMEKA